MTTTPKNVSKGDIDLVNTLIQVYNDPVKVLECVQHYRRSIFYPADENDKEGPPNRFSFQRVITELPPPEGEDVKRRLATLSSDDDEKDSDPAFPCPEVFYFLLALVVCDEPDAADLNKEDTSKEIYRPWDFVSMEAHALFQHYISQKGLSDLVEDALLHTSFKFPTNPLSGTVHESSSRSSNLFEHFVLRMEECKQREENLLSNNNDDSTVNTPESSETLRGKYLLTYLLPNLVKTSNDGKKSGKKCLSQARILLCGSVYRLLYTNLVAIRPFFFAAGGEKAGGENASAVRTLLNSVKPGGDEPTTDPGPHTPLLMLHRYMCWVSLLTMCDTEAKRSSEAGWGFVAQEEKEGDEERTMLLSDHLIARWHWCVEKVVIPSIRSLYEQGCLSNLDTPSFSISESWNTTFVALAFSFLRFLLCDSPSPTLKQLCLHSPAIFCAVLQYLSLLQPTPAENLTTPRGSITMYDNTAQQFHLVLPLLEAFLMYSATAGPQGEETMVHTAILLNKEPLVALLESEIRREEALAQVSSSFQRHDRLVFLKTWLSSQHC